MSHPKGSDGVSNCVDVLVEVLSIYIILHASVHGRCTIRKTMSDYHTTTTHKLHCTNKYLLSAAMHLCTTASI